MLLCSSSLRLKFSLLSFQMELLCSPRLYSSPRGSLHTHVLWSPIEWQPFDENALGQFCWCHTHGGCWLLHCWHKGGWWRVHQLPKSSMSGRDGPHGDKPDSIWTCFVLLLTMWIFCWDRDTKKVLLCAYVCVRQRDKSQYVPTKHQENKSVRMEHVTHHCVWIRRSEAMCGQRSLLPSWLKSILTYTNSYRHTHPSWMNTLRYITNTLNSNKPPC